MLPGLLVKMEIAVGIDNEKKTYQKIQNKNNFKVAAKVTTICK